MEVHAHSHAPRKKWTHYFWEFLMLFLAVFCGFLAENQREHYVESLRAKEYAKSLLSDLQDDTSELRHGIHQTNFIISCIDSVHSIIAHNGNRTDVPGTFYYYSRFTTNAFLVDWSKSTLIQLVQSGKLRYFKNKELVNKVNKYYALQEVIGSQNQTDRDHRLLIMQYRNRIVQKRYYPVFSDLVILQEAYGHIPSAQIDSLMAMRLPLQQDPIPKIEEYMNHLSDRKWRNKVQAEKYYPNAFKAATELINLITSEYHLSADRRTPLEK